MKADRDEASPYAAMLAAQDVAVRCKVCSLIAPIHNFPCPAGEIPQWVLFMALVLKSTTGAQVLGLISSWSRRCCGF